MDEPSPSASSSCNFNSISSSLFPTIPSAKLLTYVQSHLWNEAIAYVGCNPQDACYKCPVDGATPLHIAVLHDAPVEVIRALCEGNPWALLEQDSSGCTPLHDVCHRASDKVLRTMLQFASNLSGIATPLHIRDRSNLTPLQKLVAVWDEQITAVIRSNINPLELLSRDWILSRVWDKALCLIQSEYSCCVQRQHYSTKSAVKTTKLSFPQPSPLMLASNNRHILSMCSTIASSCPLKIFQLATLFFPSQIQEADSMGNLPLHRACMMSSSDYSSSVAPLILELLIRKFPQAASVRNVHNQLPLHIACHSGLPWSSGVSMLVDAFPDGLRIPDGATGLFPFMTMGFCYHVDSENNISNNDGRITNPQQSEKIACERINSTVKLLLLCPELERFGY